MFKPLSSYGIIGDCQSCALVSDGASINWLCLPDFDATALLCNILDDEKGGYFKISPTGSRFKSHQKYLENTNVLETLFFDSSGNASVTDLMPITGDTSQEYGIKVVRLVKAVKGNHNFELILKVTPEFATKQVSFKAEKGTVEVICGENKLVLYKKHHQLKIKGDVISINFRLKEGEQEFFALGFYNKNLKIPHYSKEKINEILAKDYFRTIDFWKSWAENCSYHGDYQAELMRSALTLKLLTYSPTGAIVASPTTSLPEKIGGSFNWDYRYTWLRDASFTVSTFLGLGYVQEAESFIQWLEKVCMNEGAMLKIMYTIKGEELQEEKTLNHLKGYMNSKPVRVGNAASSQKQFDIFGEVLTAISLYVDSGGELNESMKNFVKRLVDYCCLHYQEEDASIWENRNGYKHNTYSKLMCWVGIERGIDIAKKLEIGADLVHWEYTKKKIKKDILTNGYNKKLGSFVAYFGSSVIDTATLNIAIHKFLPINDPRVLSTIQQVMDKLVVDWFVLRSNDEKNELMEGEGAFFLSTFWLIDCLILLNRFDEARLWIDKIIHDSTPLGLYSEEFDPLTKRHLGNFPQAFTHLGLINSILNLHQAEKAKSEKKFSLDFRNLL